MAGEAAPTSPDELATHALAQLSGTEWRVFHDLRWPGRPRDSIDHVAVGPQGVFVIDTQEWSGEVEVAAGVLRHNGRRRTRFVEDVSTAAETVGALLPELQGETALPVLCLVSPEPVFGWAGETMVCSTENLLRMLTSRPQLLDEHAVDEAGRMLGAALKPAVVSGVAPPGAATAARPRRRRRASSETLAKRLILVGICAVLVSTVWRLELVPPLRDKGMAAIGELRAPTEPVGEMVTIRQQPERPALEATAEPPVVTRSTTSSVRPAPGFELLAVRMTVRNVGGQLWTSFPGTRFVLRDDSGRTHQVNPVVRTISSGRVLPDAIRLRPRRVTRGYVVFEVPKGTTIDTIELTVGPGKPETTRWKITPG